MISLNWLICEYLKNRFKLVCVHERDDIFLSLPEKSIKVKPNKFFSKVVILNIFIKVSRYYLILLLKHEQRSCNISGMIISPIIFKFTIIGMCQLCFRKIKYLNMTNLKLMITNTDLDV